MNKSIIKTLIIILFYIKSNYVYSIVNIVVSGNPGTMTISTATAGEQPDSVQEGTTTYGVQVIGDKAGIFGSINSNMPTETSLYVQLEPPNKATSTGSRQFCQPLLLCLWRVYNKGFMDL